MTRLTKNFTLEELCVTNTGLFNLPQEREKEKLLYLCSYILQPTRDVWGAIQVNSGYRSDQVNEAIGGSLTSQHPRGEAGDLEPKEADIKEVFKWMAKNLIFGQLILEYKNGVWWIHVSLPRLDKPNMMVMTFNNGKYENVTP